MAKKYEIYYFCRRCHEWIDRKHKWKIRIGNDGAILHDECSAQVRVQPPSRYKNK